MKKCVVVNNIVTPCDRLADIIEGSGVETSKKGVCMWVYTNSYTGETSRQFIGAKSKVWPNGLVFNFCPYCGERILEEDV